jgi:hypothetical protein
MKKASATFVSLWNTQRPKYQFTKAGEDEEVPVIAVTCSMLEAHGVGLPPSSWFDGVAKVAYK